MLYNIILDYVSHVFNYTYAYLGIKLLAIHLTLFNRALFVSYNIFAVC